MEQDSRQALRQFIAALERHLEAVSMRRGEDDQSVMNAYQVLKNAFLDYEEAMESTFGEWLPFVEDEDGD